MQFILDGKPHLVCCDDAQGMNVKQLKTKFQEKKNSKTVHIEIF